jgi:hypothetical protein
VPGTQQAVPNPVVGTTHETSATSVEPLPTEPLTSLTFLMSSNGRGVSNVSRSRNANSVSSGVYDRSFNARRLLRVTWLSVVFGRISSVPPR